MCRRWRLTLESVRKTDGAAGQNLQLILRKLKTNSSSFLISSKILKAFSAVMTEEEESPLRRFDLIINTNEFIIHEISFD